MTPRKHPANTLMRQLRRIHAQGRKALIRFKIPTQWEKRASGLAGRTYADYETYREHQALKHDALRDKSIRGHDARFHASLSERLVNIPGGLSGLRVLCLGARQGTEVRAFIDRGSFAVGIDLNPGRENPYVVTGDFHNLQFADDSIDVVYTNSLDHAFDLDRILVEVRRVLVAGGMLICEAGPGTAEGAGPGFYESLSWETIDDLLERIQSGGFSLEQRRRFTGPWRGEQLLLRKIEAADTQATG